MITEKLAEVLGKEGAVSIVSCADGEAHVCNTWISYLVVQEGKRILIPAYAMRKTEKNTLKNPVVQMTLGSKEVMGFNSMGSGFHLTGTARFISEGPEWQMMKDKFSFLTRVLEVTLSTVKQTL
ncbi:MAG: pyridoxamine 5'-phosphate oxidase family protein [Spirochaetota bacterium]